MYTWCLYSTTQWQDKRITLSRGCCGVKVVERLSAPPCMTHPCTPHPTTSLSHTHQYEDSRAAHHQDALLWGDHSDAAVGDHWAQHGQVVPGVDDAAVKVDLVHICTLSRQHAQPDRSNSKEVRHPRATTHSHPGSALESCMRRWLERCSVHPLSLLATPSPLSPTPCLPLWWQTPSSCGWAVWLPAH